MISMHVQTRINDYLDRTLPPDERKAVEQHLTTCSTCTKEVDSIRTIIVKLHCLPKTLQPPPDLLTGIEAKLVATLLPRQ